MPKNTLEVSLDNTKITKKNEVKIMKNGQKGTNESKLSLGSSISFWEANMICTSMIDITLNFERNNYCMQAIDFSKNDMQKN